MTDQIVQFSTGAGSAEVAVRAAELDGTLILITADTLVEDADNWRYAEAVWDYLDRPTWHRVTYGLTPMEAGRAARMIPNNRVAICSRVLKRETVRLWLDTTFDPATALIHLGYDWTEEHRYDAAVAPWQPWHIAALLRDPPYIDKVDILTAWRHRGIAPPALYAQGFQHANCGGACVRGGHAQWANLLRVNRPRFMEWEAEEETSRDELGDFAILRDRSGGTSVPIPLRRFRERLDTAAANAPQLFDPLDLGACSCDVYTDDPADPTTALGDLLGDRAVTVDERVDTSWKRIARIACVSEDPAR